MELIAIGIRSIENLNVFVDAVLPPPLKIWSPSAPNVQRLRRRLRQTGCFFVSSFDESLSAFPEQASFRAV
jgi:hypothetical protein